MGNRATRRTKLTLAEKLAAAGAVEVQKNTVTTTVTTIATDNAGHTGVITQELDTPKEKEMPSEPLDAQPAANVTVSTVTEPPPETLASPTVIGVVSLHEDSGIKYPDSVKSEDDKKSWRAMLTLVGKL